MANYDLIHIKQIIARLKELLNVKTDEFLAHKLGVAKGTISTWKAHGRLDLPLIISKCGQLDLNYVMYGKEELKPTVDDANSLKPNCAAEPIGRYAADYVTGNATMTLLNKTIRAAKESGEDPDIMKNDIFADGDDVSKRLNEWFSEIYGDNPHAFADEYGVDCDVVDAVLKGVYPLTTELANYMMASGCNLEWLIYGSGQKYNIFNKRGRLLDLISKAQKAGTATEDFENNIKLKHK
jgi:hypothetical protein